MTDNVDLSKLKLSELKQIAQEKGIKGVSGLRKQALIDRLAAELNGDAQQPNREASKPRRATRRAQSTGKGEAEASATIVEEPAADNQASTDDSSAEDSAQEDSHSSQNNDRKDGAHQSRSQARRARRVRQKMNHRRNRDNRDNDDNNNGGRNDNRRRNRDNRDNEDNDSRNNEDSHGSDRRHDNDNRGSEDRHDDRNERNDRDNNRRGGRGRSRNDRNDKNDRNDHNDKNERNNDNDDAQQPMQQIAGILDIIDSNIAFVRTTGYQAGSQDVFVPQQMIRHYGMRRGDYIQGAIRAPREGANQDNNNHNNNRGRGRNNRGRQKNNALQRVDSINMLPPENAKQRPDFSKLTPLYPNQRLRLETQPNILTTRVIDLVMPIGKGQRALIVSPPKAGKTTVLKTVANAISTNNPECHLMVVLVDERPEEVTDMQRSVNGEVIASTFDRPPSEHTAVAELAIERAKRLVELGSDVVVLLDSITRLGRAYNNSSPASGRILSGGVDSNALYPPKRFLGAARNIENGGSLTIIATAMVETGSAGDTVIFEEFKGTGNAELKLDRKIAERRVFPAVDINPSGTRKDDLLLAPDEAKLVHKLRRIMSALDSQAAIDLLIKQLKKTKSNREFMRALATSAPMAAGETEEDYI